MKLTLADSSANHLIRGYSPTDVRVGDRSFQGTVLVGPGLLVADLEPTTPAGIAEPDVQRIADYRPELAIIGWAGGQTFLSATQRRWFAERRLPVEVMELGAACRTYNVLVSDGRQPVAMLFPGRNT